MGFFPPAASRWRMIIGYARVSTAEQNLGLRHDALKPAFDASVDPTDASKNDKPIVEGPFRAEENGRTGIKANG